MFAVTVKNSLDKPFGKLANDAIMPFKAHSRTYVSVVNYVYANLLSESTFKEELAKMSPKDVIPSFEEIRKHLKKTAIQSAAQTGIKEKVRQYKKAEEALLNTHHTTILYYSANEFMGIGKSKTGENIYGLALSQARNELQQNQHKMEQKDAVYLSYIAEINLKKVLRKHNLEKYISKDKKRSMKKLVGALVQDYGRTEVYSNAPDLDTILALHEKRNIVNYTDPNSLIRIVRKNEIRSVLKRNLFDLKVAALHAFVDYAISKNVTASEDKTALKDQLFDILPSKRDEFANRILDLYSAKALPEEVKNKIKSFKAKWYFPSDKEIEHFEMENIKLPDLQGGGESVVETPGTTNIYAEGNVLSPLDDSFVFVVNNLKFKSISQYIAYEINKLYGQMDPKKLYVRIKDVKTSDLDRFNRMLEKDVLSTTKDKLLEEAINIKVQEYDVKNLIFAIANLNFEDAFNLDKTQDLYNKHKKNIVLKIQKIPSFEQFIDKDPFVAGVIRDKIDFYFLNLDNLMIHLKSKNKLNVMYDSIVEMSPFNTYVTFNSDVPKSRMPEYLRQKNTQYGLTNQSLMIIWSIVFNSIKLSEKIVGVKEYDIRYKSLLIWSKYLLSQPDNSFKTFEVMESKQEDYILTALLSILFKLKELNLKIGIPTMNKQDLMTAVHLCLGKVRQYKQELEMVEQDLEFDEIFEGENETELYGEDYDGEDYDGEDYDDDFEGFNSSSRQRFEAFLETYFLPLKNEIDLKMMEKAVYKILNNKMPLSLKHQHLNFFLAGYKLPSF
ncbi:hypothetical protein DH26_gp068 [Chloriridovirus anopheles1]|uniref:Uncharacterized protein n=1 Tax=Chloriridovirus anopheles1 TaxID=1465751 RepID=W8R9N1_9VIRU|nr:hypothetical protein DH26_gp068 [Anopheles minimus iridovirus]AHL67561.1 hypothetical protein AMIV_068 [Anopheles minimus iridovirus]